MKISHKIAVILFWYLSLEGFNSMFWATATVFLTEQISFTLFVLMWWQNFSNKDKTKKICVSRYHRKTIKKKTQKTKSSTKSERSPHLHSAADQPSVLPFKPHLKWKLPSAQVCTGWLSQTQALKQYTITIKTVTKLLQTPELGRRHTQAQRSAPT